MNHRSLGVAGIGSGLALLLLLTPLSLAPVAAGPRIFFFDGFENAARIQDLAPLDLSRWTGIQRQPGTNTISLTTERVHSGLAALKVQAGPSQGETSKAAIVREGLVFRKGDNVWSSIWYYLVAGPGAEHPVFLWDLEATKTGTSSPGRRIYLSGSDWVASDLGKWFSKEVFRQTSGSAISFPKDRWVRLKIHLFLSDDVAGKMEVWQDNNKIMSASGKTLPTAASVYDRLQVGITANSDARNAQTLFIDDVTISSDPIP